MKHSVPKTEGAVAFGTGRPQEINGLSLEPSRAGPASQAGAFTRIFVSYSRKDLAFVDRLAAALESRQIAPSIDRTEIYAFEAWWTRIEALIAAADTVVFVLSPDSLASDICRKEVEHARSLNKRLAPIVCRSVAGELDKVPAALAQLNFIFFDDPAGFDAALDQLVAALRTDIVWTRQHTQLGLEAADWRKGARSKGLLLRSPRLEEAERWIAARPAEALAPSDEILSFVLSSRQAATRRRNVLTGSLAAGLAIAVVLAGVALWQRGQAVDQRATAERQTVVAKQNAEEAERQTRVAKAETARAEAAAKAEREARDVNLREQSTTLAGVSQRLLEDGRADLARAVALEGLPQTFDPPDRPLVGRAVQAFKNAAQSDRLYAAWTVAKGRNPLSVAFSKDQRHLVVGTNAGELLIYDVAERRLLHAIQTTDDLLVELAISPDGSRVVAAGGRDAFVVDIASGALVFGLPGNPRKFFKTVAYTRDGRFILGGDADNTISVWEAGTGKLVRKIAGTEFEAPYKRYLDRTKGGFDPVVYAVAAATFQMGGATTLVADRPGSPLVAAAGDADPEAAVRFFNLEDGSAGKVMLGHGFEGGLIPRINSIAFSPDGATLVSGADDGTARLWDVATGAATQVLECASSVLATRFSPDGTLLVTASQDGSVRLWSVAKRKQIAQLAGHQRAVEWVTFSPDGEMIATASDDNTAKLWSARTGALLASLPADGVVHEATFSPDGKLVATVSRDGLVRVWRTSTEGDFLLRYSLPKGSSSSDLVLNASAEVDPAVYLGFSRDGRRVVAEGGEFKKVALWDVVGRAFIGAVEGTRFVHRTVGSDAISVMQSPLAGQTPALTSTAAERSWKLTKAVDDKWVSDYEWIVRADGTRSIGAPGWLAEPDAARHEGGDGIVLYDVPGRRILAKLDFEGWKAEKPRFSRDGKIVIAPIFTGGVYDKRRRLAAWNADTGAFLGVSSGPEEKFTLLDLSNNGRFVITAQGGYGAVKMFDSTLKWKFWTINTDDAVNAIAISTGGAFVATGSQTGRIEVIDTRQAFTRVATIQTGLKAIVKLVISDDDRLLASVDEAGLVSVFDRASGDRLAREVLPGRPVAVRFSPQSDRLVALLSDGSLFVMSDGFGGWALHDPRDMVAWGWGSLSADLKASERKRIGLDETGGRFRLALSPNAVPAPIGLPPVARGQRSAKATQCDAAAGDALDRGRAQNVAEHPIADPGKAWQACDDALHEAPADLLLRYEQARVLAASGRKPDAFAALRRTAGDGHAAAMWAVADMIDKHEASPPSGSETAASWYGRAEQAGDPRALDRKSRLLAQAARSDEDFREALRYALAIAPARPASFAFGLAAEIARFREVPDWRERALRIAQIAVALRETETTPVPANEQALFGGFAEQTANLVRGAEAADVIRFRKAALLFVAGGNHPW